MPDESSIARRAAHQYLLRHASDAGAVDVERVRQALDHVAPLLSGNDAERLITEVLSDISGLGPLDNYLEDPLVTDILVVGGRGIWVERDGRLVDTELSLDSDEILHLIERVVPPLGVDCGEPYCDTRAFCAPTLR